MKWDQQFDKRVAFNEQSNFERSKGNDAQKVLLSPSINLHFWKFKSELRNFLTPTSITYARIIYKHNKPVSFTYTISLYHLHIPV